MKTKAFLSLTLSIGLYSLLLCNCAQKTASPAKEISLKELYKDSVYLEIEGNIYEPEIFYNSLTTFDQALYRINRHSRIVNNQIIYDFHSPDEIKVSTKIFEYIHQGDKYMSQTAKQKGWLLIKEYDGQGYVYNYDRR